MTYWIVEYRSSGIWRRRPVISHPDGHIVAPTIGEALDKLAVSHADALHWHRLRPATHEEAEHIIRILSYEQ